MFTQYNQTRPNHVSEFCLTNNSLLDMCHCYSLIGINYYGSFNYKYVHNVITNMLLLNKHLFLSLLCAVLGCRCIKACDACRCTCLEDERPCTVPPCRCKHYRCRNRAVSDSPTYLDIVCFINRHALHPE